PRVGPERRGCGDLGAVGGRELHRGSVQRTGTHEVGPGADAHAAPRDAHGARGARVEADDRALGALCRPAHPARSPPDDPSDQQEEDADRGDARAERGEEALGGGTREDGHGRPPAPEYRDRLSGARRSRFWHSRPTSAKKTLKRHRKKLYLPLELAW